LREVIKDLVLGNQDAFFGGWQMLDVVLLANKLINSKIKFKKAEVFVNWILRTLMIMWIRTSR